LLNLALLTLCLRHSRQILADYHKSIGGAPSTNLKKTKSKQSLRRQASADESPAPSKRQKRNGTKEAPAEVDANETWTPTREDWEPLVVRIDTVEREESGQLLAYILFNNGKKTKVGMDKVYRHCPRPMLKFYENHLKFK
jgi:chromobox protein 1